MRRRLISLVMAVCFVLWGLADVRMPELRFRHITTENGLPSNRVRDIAQDNDGFIWFATDGGLTRYDGRNVKVFQPATPKKSKDDIFVLTIFPYRNGLLVGTDHGLFGYDSKKESLGLLPLNFKDNIKGRMEGSVLSITADDNENIWVSVAGEGVYFITATGEVSEFYDFPDVGDYISGIYIDEAGSVWAVSNYADGGIFKFDKRLSRFNRFPVVINGEKLNRGGSVITGGSDGDLWLGTRGEGLLRFNPLTGEGNYYPESNHCRTPWHIHSLTQYSPGILMVGSDSGLMLFDMSSGEYTLYEPDELDPESMSGRFVYPVLRDSEGGLWIGTFYRGVNYIGKDSSRIHKWRHSRFVNSVGGNVISRICEGEHGSIWIGSADGGLCHYNPATKLFTHYPLTGSLETDNINAICTDGDKLWLGTYSKGVGILDLPTGRWKEIPVEGELHSSCYAICKDSSGRIWTGATETLTLYNPSKNMFEKVSNLKAWIYDIHEDDNGELWIATQGSGLFRYNPETRRWKNYKSTGHPGALPHDHVNSVMVDPANHVYVATPRGVSVYDYDKDRFTPLKGYPEGYSASAIEKSGDDLWISSNKGIICINPEGEAKIYTVNDGLSDDQFLPGSSSHVNDGTLYYGSVYGLSAVNPMAFRNVSSAPAIKFTNLEIMDREIPVGDTHLPSSLNSLDKLELNNSDHTFTIYFSPLSYANPEGNRCLYRLEGFDKVWREAGNDNSATYSNLPAGTYVLRVKAANSDGIWNDEGIALKIVVKPAWYLSTFMKLLYLVLSIGLLLLLTRYVLWRMERSHMNELERISDNKEKEMFRSKLSFFTVVAHEIRTPVSLIIGPLEKVMGSGENFTPKVREDLHVIDRNARRLLSLVNQLLDYKKVEDNALPAGFRHEKIIPQLESILERFRPSMEQKGISLTTKFPDPDMTVDVDPEAITKLFSNLLSNAMKFTGDSIEVVCEPVADSEDFMISVADNGIGINKENKDKIFKPFFQVLDNINEARGGTGLGLSIVSSVTEAHGGRISLDSEPGHGARFTVILPCRQKNIIPSLAKEEISPEEPGKERMSPDDTVIQDDPVLLVVDDNEEMVRFISSNFEKNYEVVTAADGKEALERMKEKPVSLIICDWMMPVMDGEEFLRKIRHDENYSHIPFVMLTAKTDNVSKITSMRSGADAYVEKPFSIGYLEARIENLLEMRRLLQRKYSQSPLEPITSIAPTQTDNELLGRLQALIEENFSNPNLSVDFLADHLGISRSGLYAKIRTLADVTPNELIQITRLKKAAELLAENKYRINEICYMVGFNSSSYFSRCFQKQFGMKPGEFAARTL